MGCRWSSFGPSFGSLRAFLEPPERAQNVLRGSQGAPNPNECSTQAKTTLDAFNKLQEGSKAPKRRPKTAPPTTHDTSQTLHDDPNTPQHGSMRPKRVQKFEEEPNTPQAQTTAQESLRMTFDAFNSLQEGSKTPTRRPKTVPKMILPRRSMLTTIRSKTAPGGPKQQSSRRSKRNPRRHKAANWC